MDEQGTEDNVAQHADRDEKLRRASADASALLQARNSARSRDEADQSTRRVREPAREVHRHAQPQKMTLGAYISHNAIYIVGAAAVVAIVMLLLMAVKSCTPTPTYDYDGELDFDYTSPYDWNELKSTESGRLIYGSDGREGVSRSGVDVSENQGSIDWKAVKADSIDFVMIRLGYRGATEGDLYVDELFAENLEGAKAAGVDCGVYFFSQAKNEKEARAEADFVVKTLDGAKLEYPVAFDFESAVAGVDAPRAAGLGKDKMTKIADAFCKRIEKAGYLSMVYGNYYDLDLYHYNSLKGKAVWWAEYDVAEPNPHLDIVMWQYANDGWIDGISTPVDLNIDLSGVL